MIDIVIQAGHVGRTTGNTGTVGTPTAGDEEIQLTPIVARIAGDTLRAAGFAVVVDDAVYDKKYDCKLAVAVHFDGASTPGSSGASIGYPDGTPAGSNKPAADKWKTIYGEVWPFKWMPDNFTANLRGYYGYNWTSTTIAEVLFELGELTDPVQSAWLVRHTHDGFLGRLIAYWASVMLGKPIVKPVLDKPPAAGVTEGDVKRWIAAAITAHAALPGDKDGVHFHDHRLEITGTAI